MYTRQLSSMFLRCLPLVLAVACLCAADGPRPGLRTDLPYVDDPAYTYDIFIPSSFGDDPDRTYPVWFHLSPVGDPNLKRFVDWAEEMEFILIALNNSRNGSWENNRTAQDGILATIAARGIPAHHCLKYASGLSGGGMASVRFVGRYPEQFAGVHLSAHSGNGHHAAPFHAVTLYAGRKDKVHSLGAVERAANVYESQGNPLRFDIHPGGHDQAKPDLLTDYLAWMYWRTLLAHPALTPEDVTAGRARIAAEAERIAELSAPARADAAATLLSVESIARSAAAEGLLQAWGTALAEQASTEADDVSRFWLLMEASQQPWFRGVDRDVRKELTDQLRDLRREDAIRTEYKAYGAWMKVSAMAEKANTDSKHQRVQAGWKAIAEAFPDTRYGRQAAQEVE